jgi:cysteine desulfurase
LGVKEELAHSSIRFGIGRFTTEEQIDKTITIVKNAVRKLRDISPLWEMFQEGIDIDSIKWEHH